MNYNLSDLKYLMQRLRDPESGCPWDIQQDWEDIIPHTLEEVYEVVDAIGKKDWPHVTEELGDLLFQVVFYAQIADEEQRFDLDTIIHQLVEKLIRRHPHVFPNGQLFERNSLSELDHDRLSTQWEEIKATEKAVGESVFDTVPIALPSLQRMQKLQKKASGLGYDWQSAKELLPVIRSELDELVHAFDSGNAQSVAEESGDLMFSLVNLIRKLGMNAEQISGQANQKFEQRIRWIESYAREHSILLDQMSESQLDELWQKSKKLNKN